MPVPGGSHGEAEAEQRQQAAQHREKNGQTGMRQQPRADQIGVAGGLTAFLQQGSSDGDLNGGKTRAFRQVVDIQLLRVIQQLVALRQIKVGQICLASVRVGYDKLAGGELPGECIGKQPGQLRQKLLGGFRVIFGGVGRVRVDEVVRLVQQPYAVQLGAEIVVGHAETVVALLLIQGLPQVCAVVQKDVVADQYTNADAAQHGQTAQHQRQHEGSGLGPGLVQPFSHLIPPSIL